MRTVQWLFVVSAALFICGIGFVVVGARSARQQAPSAVERPVMVPVATVKQLMRGIVGPGAMVVFEAVSTTVSVKGVVEKAPQNDEEWAEVIEPEMRELFQSHIDVVAGDLNTMIEVEGGNGWHRYGGEGRPGLLQAC